MVGVPLGLGAYERRYGKTPPVVLVNRFFEADPTNRVNGVSLYSRPGTTYLAPSGSEGPVRGNFTLKDVFNDALFTVSGPDLQMLLPAGTRTAIAGVVLGEGIVSMDATETTLWVADGASLQFYQAGGSRANGSLTVTAAAQPANTNTVTINGAVYTFKTVLTAAAGDVLIGTNAADSLLNLYYAINRVDEFAGSKFAAATVVNPYVFADLPSATVLVVKAKVGGTAGNAYTTVEGIANWAWGAGTLAGGALNTLSGVQTPDDVGIVSVAVFGGYTFCAAAQSEIIYWINPGEITIDPINRIAAEDTPDQIISLMVDGDQMCAFGADSTQYFYLDGTENVVAPIKGRGVGIGILPGTETRTPNGSPVIVGTDGVVYVMSGSPQRISNNGIEELIRRAREIERLNP